MKTRTSWLTVAFSTTIMITSTNGYANGQSFGYQILKETISHADFYKNRANFETATVNAGLDQLAQICADQPQDCNNPEAFDIVVTEAMQKAYSAMSDGFPYPENTYHIPANSITYNKLNDNAIYDHRIDFIDNGDDYTWITVIQWNDAGDKKAFDWTVEADDDSHNISAVFSTADNDRDSIKVVGDFSDSVMSGNFSLNMTEQENNSVTVTSVYSYQEGASEFTYSMTGRADDDGGYIETSYQDPGGTFSEKESFNGNGDLIDYVVYDDQGQVQHGSEFTEDEYTFDEHDIDYTQGAEPGFVSIEQITYTDGSAVPDVSEFTVFVVVASGDLPTEKTIVGSGHYFDFDGNGNLNEGDIAVDYYGDPNRLAPVGSASDVDNLDIYIAVDSYDQPFKQIQNVWLESED